MECKLTRVTDNNHTRTIVMVGWAEAKPKVGQRFTILNDQPLNIGSYTHRMISTSVVQKVEETGNTIRFLTENTEYIYEAL